jgi:murein L,D-transpeptidase YcbB/YkuD
MLMRFLAVGMAALAIVAGAAEAKQPARPRVATTEPAPHLGNTPAAPATAAPEAPAAAAPAPPSPTDPLAIAIQQRLTAGTKGDDGDRGDAAAMQAFYAEHVYAPLWTSAGGMTPKAAAAIAEIKKADDWGLDASAFVVPEAATVGADNAALADAEVKLSAAVLKYARHARGGRIPDPAGTLSSYLDRAPQLLPAHDVLAKIASADAPDAALRGFHPQHPQFEKLRQKYLEMRAGTAAEEVVKLPSGAILKPGKADPQVALLRQRLKVAAPAGVDETMYDDTLKTAVMAFQKESGVARPDGLVGNATRASLNDVETIGPEKVLANMEEWRWMPEPMGEFYVWDNIPEFTLRVVKNNKIIHTERIITGLVDKQTPVFSENMKTIVFRPRWNVPNSIKVKELWAGLARGGESFERQGLRLSQNGRPVDPASVDWSSTDIRRFDVYQPAGERNALGNIKFAFPNKHDVYMHDTPNKTLFEAASRPFSHGCMRVRNPEVLADVLLGEDKGWDAAKIKALITTGPENNEVPIEHKITVHVTYFTAWVDGKGELQTARDVYGHEKRIALALAGKWDQIVRGPDHLAPVKVDAEVREAIGQSSGGFQSVGNFMQSVLSGNF